eukprot:CAMPEP_0182839654 /NCGR_PEP_ID=MMETSP0006_2-20121128/23984_1 /TAXON_ID=97485 /ORGANISM="Prymnesium parvum, Strain Texoma1" /LENGTH=75 /DNA_ID=CAMNT_0024968823 /DNA_START=210 /DNA_END=434 /DNA_ORIENTATION=-
MSTSRAQAFSALVPRHAVETPLSSVARASAESVSRAQAAILAAALAASFSAAPLAPLPTHAADTSKCTSLPARCR